MNRWIDVRSPKNKLMFRYDPERDLIEYVHRGEKTVVDLKAYKPVSVQSTL